MAILVARYSENIGPRNYKSECLTHDPSSEFGLHVRANIPIWIGAKMFPRRWNGTRFALQFRVKRHSLDLSQRKSLSLHEAVTAKFPLRARFPEKFNWHQLTLSIA